MMYPDLFTIGYLANDRQREYRETARLARLRRSAVSQERLASGWARFSFRRPANIAETMAS